jgi:SAM-dependent methyltransferase
MESWEKAIEANKALWNELTAIHSRGETYGMTAFKNGTKQLDPLVRAEVGDVAGKSMLHLQCHFGMDSLMWSRLGAQVTGIDLAEDAITLARSLSAEIGVPATFIRSNLYDLPSTLQGEFDVVYSSWGVLYWLPDLTRWGQIIARYLKPGGFFYVAEGHPFLNTFYNEPDAINLRPQYGYFPHLEPAYWPPSTDYADQTQTTSHPSYEWQHSVGEILDALLAADLRIEFFHEHSFLTWNYFPFMVKGEDGYWRLPPEYPTLPLSFSLKAIKPV